MWASTWDRRQMVGDRGKPRVVPQTLPVEVPQPAPPPAPKVSTHPGRAATFQRKRPRWTDANNRPTKR